MNDELKAAAERLQAFIRKHDPGQCRMLSEGHSCPCLLCDVSRLGGAAIASIAADEAARAEREKLADDEWLYAQTRGTQFYLKWDCETREVFLNGLSLGIKKTQGDWLDLMRTLGIQVKP
jgi:hypothetical protein